MICFSAPLENTPSPGFWGVSFPLSGVSGAFGLTASRRECYALAMRPLPPELMDTVNALSLSFNRHGMAPLWPRGHRISPKLLSIMVDDFTVWYFFQGKGELIDHRTGNRYPLHSGVCLCMMPGVNMEVIQDDDNPLRDTFIHFDIMKDGRKLRPEEWPIAPLHTEMDYPAWADQLTRMVLTLLNQLQISGVKSARDTTLQAEYLMKSLFIELHRITLQNSEAVGGRRYEKAINSVLTALYDDPRSFHSVEDMAAASGYSPSHFSALCSRITGNPPGRHLILSRIGEAKRLLRATELTVSDISENLGYDNVFYFSRQFRHVVGVTALQYRRKIQGGGSKRQS